MKREFLTARLNRCERRTRGLDLPPSGPAWLSTTTSLSGCIRFIEAMSPLPQAWGFDECASTPVQDYNGDNAEEHRLPQKYHVSRQIFCTIAEFNV